MTDLPLCKLIDDLVEKIREPLGLDRWTVKINTGPQEDPAACIAQPEYLHAKLFFDLDKLETGDELDELVIHEATHCHTAAIHDVALALSDCVADCAPEYMRAAIKKKLDEEVRWAAEHSTTRVGHSYLRLLRRLWAAETETAALKAEIRILKKQIPA